MPHPLPLLAAVAAAPLLGLAMHAAPAHPGALPAPRAVSILPNNLCASCHGRGRTGSREGAVLQTRDLVAARTFLPGLPQG